MEKKKKKVASILARKHEVVQPYVNPVPIVNLEAVSDESGNVKYVEREPVALSMAQDFSVTNNALLNRSGSPLYRISQDIVDTPAFLDNMTDFANE